MGPTCTRTICFEAYQRGNNIVGKLPDDSWVEFPSRKAYEDAYIDMFGKLIEQCLEVMNADS